MKIDVVNPASARLGPHSTKIVAPEAYMRSIWSTHSTGAATCLPNRSRIASGSEGYQPEVTLQVTGRRGGQILYLDDRPENAEAGRARGWEVIQHRDPAESTAVVEKFGLLDGC